MKGAVSSAELRNFGLLVGAIFAGVFGLAAPWLHHARIPFWPWVLGSALVATGTLAPGRLRYPYAAWIRVGQALGWVNSRIVLNLLFFGIFVPAASLARLVRWDPMKRKFAPEEPSYRVRRTSLPSISMEKPY